MKKIVVSFISVLILSVPSVFSQTFHQGLFLDGYRLNYRYNPALVSDSGFLSVGQWAHQSINNIGAANFLFPTGEGVVTGLHSSISPEEFLDHMPDMSCIRSRINFNLFSYGFAKGENYHTVEANVRALYGVTVPKDIFTILKVGNGEGTYGLGGLNLNGSAYAELAYGYSRKLSDIVSLGFRAKLLVGVEAINYNVSQLDLKFDQDDMTMSLDADFDLTSRWSKIHPDEDGYYRLNLGSLSAKDRWRLPSGAGLALDMGIVITPLEGLTISAALTDLGGIVWYYGNAGKSKGTSTFSGFNDLRFESIKEGKILDNLEDVGNQFLSSVLVKAVKARTVMTPVPFNADLAVKYELPFYRAVAVGLTGNYLAYKGLPYYEGRFAASWNPCKYFGIMGDIGFGSLYEVYSVAINAGVGRFRATASLSNGFGGTIPYTSTPLLPRNKVITVGLTYDL